MILRMPVSEMEKEKEKSMLQMKNVTLFSIERFCLLFQLKSILLFYESFFFLFFLILF